MHVQVRAAQTWKGTRRTDQAKAFRVSSADSRPDDENCVSDAFWIAHNCQEQEGNAVPSSDSDEMASAIMQVVHFRDGRGVSSG